MNGQEKDVELAAGMYTAEYWEYDSRIGRRWNMDPVVKPWESSYMCFANNPILYADPNGDDVSYETTGDRVRVFFKRIFSKSFREKFNANKNDQEMHTYRLRNNMPDLKDATDAFVSGRTFTSEGASDTGDGLTIVTANYNVDYSIGDGAGDAALVVIPLYKKIVHKEKEVSKSADYEYQVSSSRIVYDDKHPIFFDADAYPDNINITSVDENGNKSVYDETIVYQNGRGGSNFPNAKPISPLNLKPRVWDAGQGKTVITIVISSEKHRPTEKSNGKEEPHNNTHWTLKYYKWRYAIRKPSASKTYND